MIDVRQSYLQKLLKQALIAVGHPEGAERSHHFSYEMVALSHATARELGFAPPPDSEDAKRPFVEVSGRKGLGVKADDLLDTVIQKAGAEVAKRNADLDEAALDRTAHMIGIAAVRYFLIKFSRGKVIAFDLDEALSFQGESGPYIQYAVVRINNIFRKLQERDGLDEAALVAPLATLPAGELTGDNGHELWSLVLEAATAGRGRRTGRGHAGILGAGQIRLRPGAGLQRVLQPAPEPIVDSQRGTGRGAPVAGGGGDLSAQPADARIGPHGHRRSCENVAVPVIAIAPCSKPHDYEAAIERAGGEILRLDRATDRPADVIAKVDGVLLPGGGDVLPSLYGEAAHPKFCGR